MTYSFMAIKPPFDVRKNFWNENFQISLLDPFKKLYDRDKSKDKVDSSNEMWCIWLLKDPNYHNKIYRQSPEQQRSAVLSYYPDFGFSDSIINECLLHYDSFLLSDAAKSFKKEEETLRKFASLIEDKLEEDEITLDSYVTLDRGGVRLVKGTANQIVDLKKKIAGLYPQYDKIKKTFEQEQSEIRLYGGGTETILESGELLLLDDED